MYCLARMPASGGVIFAYFPQNPGRPRPTGLSFACDHYGGMTEPPPPHPPQSRRHGHRGAVGRQSFASDDRGTAMIETALLLPLFLTLLLGILIYGQYFLLAHSVQQAANDGARAAIAGLDAADRRTIAVRAVDRSMAGVGDYGADRRDILVSETADSVTVALAFHVPEGSILRSSFVPAPGPVIRAAATFELAAE